MRRDAFGTSRLALDGAEERILALLAIACGKIIGPIVLASIRRASTYWSQGETILAEIELALAGLPALKDEEEAACRLALGEKLLAGELAPRELVKACGLDPAPLDLVKAGYDPAQPRVPAGNPAGGEWTSGDNSGNGTDSGFGFTPAMPLRADPPTHQMEVITPPATTLHGYATVYSNVSEAVQLPPATSTIQTG